MNTFYKIAEVIEYAEKNDDEYIVAFQYNDKCARRYTSYEDLKEYITDNKYKNKHAYEILKKGDKCKLYLDIEFVNDDENDFEPNNFKFEEIKQSLKKHYKEYFKMELEKVVIGKENGKIHIILWLQMAIILKIIRI